ncbi:MAG TPA: quinol:electron acceptor oxidoreductase subunit ActD [Gemmatimonadaceae bacterium]|nr:quinol:electron acceptor oxidoreductase subunit ActD [Gemmatimonadaceae bacterium]
MKTDIRLLAEFAHPGDLLRAVETLRREQYHDLETYTPFDIPELDESLGLRRSRLGWLALAGGIAGLLVSYGIQWWANVHSYPLNVGGRPQHAVPAFLLATFEGTVLAASLAVFFGVLIVLRLPRLWSSEDDVDDFQRASIDRYWLAMRTFASERDRSHAEHLLRDAGALRTITRLGPSWVTLARPLVLVIALAIGLNACTDHVANGFDWKRMRGQPKYMPYGSSDFFVDGKAMRSPPGGTIPREAVLRPSGTAESATVLRGANRFVIFCAVCHGEHGDSAGVVGDNMQPKKPPSLLDPAVRALTSEQLYKVITDGFGYMPSYSAELTAADRWAVVAYVGRLQTASRTDSTRGVSR